MATMSSSIKSVRNWLATLPLTEALASAFHVLDVAGHQDDDPSQADTVLEALTNLTDEQMEMVLREGCNAVVDQVKKGRQRLKECLDKQKEQKQAQGYKKYCEDLKVMSCGSVEAFHGGLIGRVGMPDLNFLDAMQAEHCVKYGHDLQFTSSNYAITTTPHREWDLIMTPQTRDQACSSEHEMLHGRVIPDVDELVQSKVAVKARLSKAEVVALVLYTGPMYTRYNTMLRQFPTQDHADFAANNNTFATTIFVLVSAVQKIARCTPVPPGTMLYRGLGGMHMLPDRFTRGDPQYDDVKGFTEWGFMSTTSNRQVAVQYSGVRQGRPQAMVMMIEPNAVDRGACIRDFSQYPGEEEYLWVPCSFIQPHKDAVLEIVPEGLLTILSVHVNANIKADTVEELVDRKKKMHLTAFSTIIDNLKPTLIQMATQADADERLKSDTKYPEYNPSYTVESMIQSIVDECFARLERHKQQDAQTFVDDAMFREMVQEMLNVQLWAKHKLMLWLNDYTYFIFVVQHKDLRTCHRRWVMHVKQQMKMATTQQERKQWATKYLQAQGLIKQAADETSPSGETRILEAASDGWAAQDIQALIFAGVDINIINEWGTTPVQNSAYYDNVDCIKVLVKAGADLNIANNGGSSPLSFAALHGHIESVKELVPAGAHINHTNDRGFTPLCGAARNGHFECVKWLISAGADISRVNNDGDSALHLAAFEGHTDCVKELLAAGADASKPNNAGASPAMLAEQQGHQECVRVLQQKHVTTVTASQDKTLAGNPTHMQPNTGKQKGRSRMLLWGCMSSHKDQTSSEGISALPPRQRVEKAPTPVLQ